MYDLIYKKVYIKVRYYFLSDILQSFLHKDFLIVEKYNKVELSNQLEDSFEIVFNFYFHIIMDFIPYLIKYLAILFVISRISYLLMFSFIILNVLTFIFIYFTRNKISFLENQLFLKSIHYSSFFTNIILSLENIRVYLNQKNYLDEFSFVQNDYIYQFNHGAKFKLFLEIILLFINLLFNISFIFF